MKKIDLLVLIPICDETIKQNIIFSEDEENINIRMLENSIQFQAIKIN